MEWVTIKKRVTRRANPKHYVVSAQEWAEMTAKGTAKAFVVVSRTGEVKKAEAPKPVKTINTAVVPQEVRRIKGGAPTRTGEDNA